jgi:hypothetical protein
MSGKMRKGKIGTVIGGRNERVGEEVEDKVAYVYKKPTVEFLTFTSKLKYCTKEWER